MDVFTHLNEEAKEAARMMAIHGSQRKTAEALGITRSKLARRLIRAKKIEGAVAPVDVPEGMAMLKTTVQYDGNGNVIQEWRRLLPQANELHEFVESLIDKAKGKGRSFKFRKRADDKSDIMKEICINDAHIGRLCWGEESGRDYDLKIAKEAVMSAVCIALGESSYGKITLVFGGDTMHVDNRNNRSEKSNHTFDVDGRYSKIIGVTRAVMQDAVLKCSQHAPRVEVIIISGNHDWHAAVALRNIVDAYFFNCDNIHVDITPTPRICRVWGNTMLVWAHGDCVKPAKWAEVVAAEFPREWADTKYRFVHLGHIHHRKTFATQPINALPGITVEFLDALCTPDSWHCEHGYVGITPATQAFTHHKKWGMIDTQTITLDRALNVTQ